MRVHFLLGPAGSGKTWRCLADIRTELKQSPDGPPLLLLAPKQATFQLERQLLDDPNLAGYSRLQIVSFDRLARWLLETFATVPELLDDEGRVMVLRALLAREHASLRVFRATARLPGFARQLSQLLREFQRHQLTPAKLARLADRCAEHAPLRDKLHDLHHLLRAYHEWLEHSEIQDADQLLDLATELLRTAPSPRPQTPDPIPHSPIGGLWLDGFAEMTPQELDLLCAVLPFCRTATLAFCLDPQAADSKSWLSLWSGIRHTYSDCLTRIKALPTCEPSVEELPRAPAHSRFAASPELAHLEASWTAPTARAGGFQPPPEANSTPNSSLETDAQHGGWKPPALALTPPHSPFPIPHSLLPVLARFRELTAARALTTLSPSAVSALYARDLATSVSKLEQFAECPFKFFVAAGLRAQERKEFELDHRERGSFIHRLLDEFHLRVTAGRDRERDTPLPQSQPIPLPGRRWRDLTPAAAADLAARIGEDLLASPEFALFAADDSRRFTARTLIASAQRLLAALVGWMPHYAFDPVAVELAFGLGPNPPLPALRLALADGNSLTLRGRIDRVDLCRDPATGATLAVVVDYKSSPKKLEPQKVAAGLQLQLLAYLNVLRTGATAPDPRASVLDCGGPPPLSDAHDARERQRTGAVQNLADLCPPLASPEPELPPTAHSAFRIPHSALHPCGVFYIPLHGAASATGDRAEILAEDEATRRATYQHAGRFDFTHRPQLDDRANAQPSGQFRYTLNKDGALSKRSGDALPTTEFTDLLTQVEANLRRLGEAIFAGEVTVAPVRLSASDNACARCDYRPICRFDPWTQPFRALPKPVAKEATT